MAHLRVAARAQPLAGEPGGWQPVAHGDRGVSQRAVPMRGAMTDARSLLFRVRRGLAGFKGDRSGVSAVEFALLLPLMLPLYVGGLEISNYVSAGRKVTITARSTADLVARVSSVASKAMTDVFAA